LTQVPDDPHVRYLNRELSWLEFNARVLALAEDAELPLLERVKFCAIASSNLDEFFQVRVAALKDQVAAGIHTPSPDGRTPAQQLLEIGDRVEVMIDQQEELLLRTLLPALAAAALPLLRWEELERNEAKQLVDVFEQRIFPVLTPLAVDPAHPFPYISSLSLNLAVIVRDPATGDRRFARVKVPPSLPRFQPVPGGRGMIALENIIAAQLGALFPGMDIVDHWAFRVTRNADLSIDEDNEEAEDLLAAVEVELRRRRFGRAVRLEVAEGMGRDIVDLLVEELDLDAGDVSFHEAPLDLRDLMQLTNVDRPDLRDDPWPALTPPALADAQGERSIFSVLRERDVLVHHPYDSFVATVEEFVRQAADDPKVLSIKTTLYRTAPSPGA
jgi:polyphosphate kinase